jgi:hypothetical protein|tara:strand:- start:3415 stop:3831 length:417 start_codon:yes stop_codon:yes gene_type:complete
MENAVKIITLASFVLNDKVESFKKYLQKRFRTPEDKIFIYTSEEEQDKQILTFRVYLKDGKKINTKSFFPTTIIVHKKGECFYTINALNKLIESEVGLEKGNINYKEHEIDWDKYQGKMLIVKNGNLVIMDINRNFSE